MGDQQGSVQVEPQRIEVIPIVLSLEPQDIGQLEDGEVISSAIPDAIPVGKAVAPRT